MKRILVILITLLLTLSITTAAPAEYDNKLVTEIMEIQIETSQASITSNADDQTTINFDISNMKPGDTEVFRWSVQYLGKMIGNINYLRLRATQDGGKTNEPESVNDPDNSGDLGSLLICTLNYDGQDYILPMDEVLSPNGMVYDPKIFLDPNQSAIFSLTFYWPNHTDDNIGQGDVLENNIDIGMIEIEPTPAP